MNNFLKSWNEKNNRIIVFAGVFDPVHKGHISAAREALRGSGKKLVFLPEKVPQHKHQATDYKHRLEMLKIATKSQKNISVADYPKEKQYIKETFRWLKDQHPGSNFVWLVGSDVISSIDKWPGSESLKNLGVVEILVFTRDGDKPNDDLVKEIGGARVVYKLRKKRNKKHENYSSRYILEDLKHRQSILPDGVYTYIKENGLYSVSDSFSE